MLIVKQFPVHKCGHEKKPISASECLLSLMKNNSVNHYILATQDQSLTERVRQFPGSPIVYMKANAINIEKPSDASNKQANSVVESTTKPNDQELESLKELKKQELGITDDIPIRKKRKVKGPNPLSVKKKKQAKPKPNDIKKVDGTGAGKRTRKRKMKMPRQMEKLLNS